MRRRELIVALTCLVPTVGLAAMAETHGNIKVYRQEDSKFWCQLVGTLQADETVFFGSFQDKGNDFPSGSDIRRAYFGIQGGVGTGWEYKLQVNFRGQATSFVDAWVAYTDLPYDANIALGQFTIPFGLENVMAVADLFFLEQSLPGVAFDLDYGIGVIVNGYWADSISLAATIFSPKQMATQINGGAQGFSKSDRLGGAFRLVYTPVHTDTYVYHLGLAAWYQGVAAYDATGAVNQAAGWATTPEAVARYVTTTQGTDVFTTAALVNTAAFQASSQGASSLELLGIWGPLCVLGEYNYAYNKRNTSYAPQGSVNFHGYYAQAGYALTGESRTYDPITGTLGRILPNHCYGAVELMARYSFINLSDKDIAGGMEHNTSIGVNWYVNNYVRLASNYIYARIHPAQQAPVRTLGILAVRAQVAW